MTLDILYNIVAECKHSDSWLDLARRDICPNAPCQESQKAKDTGHESRLIYRMRPERSTSAWCSCSRSHSSLQTSWDTNHYPNPSNLSAYIYGLLYLLLSTFSAVWIDRHKESVDTAGLNYISMGLGYVLGTQICAPINDYVRKAPPSADRSLIIVDIQTA
jgi:hypothetical protein